MSDTLTQHDPGTGPWLEHLLDDHASDLGQTSLQTDEPLENVTTATLAAIPDDTQAWVLEVLVWDKINATIAAHSLLDETNADTYTVISTVTDTIVEAIRAQHNEDYALRELVSDELYERAFKQPTISRTPASACSGCSKPRTEAAPDAGDGAGGYFCGDCVTAASHAF